MPDQTPCAAPPEIDYEVLAVFRQSLRRLQHETDENARAAQLTPQQHQVLLAIKGGHPGRTSLTITEIAEALMVRHHSAVEMVGRLAAAGLVARRRSDVDRRQAMVSLTAAGEAVLGALSESSLRVLRRAAPALRDLLRMLASHGFDAGAGPG